MNNLNHPLVVDSEHTCHGYPDQYEGTLTDGRIFYLRYRHGFVSLGVGATLGDAVDDPQEAVVQISDGQGEFESEAQRDRVFAELIAQRLGGVS